MKGARIRERVSAGMEARADQGEVWREVDATSVRLGVNSPTHALHDAYESRRGRLHQMLGAIRLHDGQLGAITAINGELWVFDYVSRPDAFASLHGPLAQGYALDALDRGRDGAEAPEPQTASGFALLTTDCPVLRRRPGVGLGENVWFTANGVAGSALVHEGELVQLTAFPGEGPANRPDLPPRAAGRIRRPSRRR
jgi:hypothetical protein